MILLIGIISGAVNPQHLLASAGWQCGEDNRHYLDFLFVTLYRVCFWKQIFLPHCVTITVPTSQQTRHTSHIINWSSANRSPAHYLDAKNRNELQSDTHICNILLIRRPPTKPLNLWKKQLQLHQTHQWLDQLWKYFNVISNNSFSFLWFSGILSACGCRLKSFKGYSYCETDTNLNLWAPHPPYPVVSFQPYVWAKLSSLLATLVQ